MLVFPVIDLKGGLVVHGVAGQRASYRPIHSPLCPDDARPLTIARALSQEFDLACFYVADLDAIEGRSPDWEALRRIADEDRRILLDAGIDGPAKAKEIEQRFPRGSALQGVVVGLETIAGPQQLASVATLLGERAIFSLDLRDGQPVTETRWRTWTPLQIADQVARAGIRRMIVLDLARVGTGQGVGHEWLFQALRESQPEMQLIAGGGVRDGGDLQTLWQAGCDGVLMATALHQRRVSRDELQRLTAPPPPRV